MVEAAGIEPATIPFSGDHEIQWKTTKAHIVSGYYMGLGIAAMLSFMVGNCQWINPQ